MLLLLLFHEFHGSVYNCSQLCVGHYVLLPWGRSCRDQVVVLSSIRCVEMLGLMLTYGVWEVFLCVLGYVV